MAGVQFFVTGHKNIKATHKTTLEFTKDRYLTPQGDCIVGICADFNLVHLLPCLNKERIRITIRLQHMPHISETIYAVPNPAFNDHHEMVIRTTNFISPRTFAVRSTKSSRQLNRKLIEGLRHPDVKAVVVIE